MCRQTYRRRSTDVQQISYFPLETQQVCRELTVEVSSVVEAAQIQGCEQMAVI